MKRLVVAGLLLFMAGCASTPRMETITSFRSFNVPATFAPERLVAPVKQAVGEKADNLVVTQGLLAEELPEKPGSFETGLQQIAGPFGMNMSFPTVKCPNAYTVISNTGGFASGGSSQNDRYTACLYPYKTGTRVHVVLVSTTTHQAGLAGMVNASIKDSLVGGNQGSAERSLDKISTKFSALVSGAELIRSSKTGEVGGILPK